MKKTILNSPIYIATAETECWKCNNIMKTTAIIAPNMVGDDEDFEDGGVGILLEVTFLPEFLLKKIQALNPNYQLRYSKSIEGKYYANVCPHCNVISGDFFLHSEPGSAFFPTSVEEAKQVKLKKIELNEAIEVEASYSLGLGEFILENGNIKE